MCLSTLPRRRKRNGRFNVSESRGPVAILPLNRPQILNAWHTRMREMLLAALEAAESNDAIRAIIMTGTGVMCSASGRT